MCDQWRWNCHQEQVTPMWHSGTCTIIKINKTCVFVIPTHINYICTCKAEDKKPNSIFTPPLSLTYIHVMNCMPERPMMYIYSVRHEGRKFLLCLVVPLNKRSWCRSSRSTSRLLGVKGCGMKGLTSLWLNHTCILYFASLPASPSVHWSVGQVAS